MDKLQGNGEEWFLPQIQFKKIVRIEMN